MSRDKMKEDMEEAVKALVEACSNYNASICYVECPIREYCIAYLKDNDAQPYWWDIE